MTTSWAILAALLIAAATPPGTHRRTLTVDGLSRSYIVHVPRTDDPSRPLPVVLALHGAGMNGALMMWYTGLNRTADSEKFIAVYPNGTGFGPFLSWNAGGVIGPLAAGLPDDVAFLNAVIDDVADRSPVDARRIFACGYSNGGMMSYQLAIELSDRIAAIGSVAGTMTSLTAAPSRPLPILHFHGTDDFFVPPDGPNSSTPPFLTFLSVDETLQAWCEYNGCDFDAPSEFAIPDQANDGTTVTQLVYGPGEDDSEVIYFEIQQGGHTWPGGRSPFGLLGKTTRDVSANDELWQFFMRHPLPAP